MTAHRFDALITQSKHATGLAFGWDLQHYLAIERRHLDAAAECSDHEADGHLAAQVHSVALEDRVLAHLDLDIQITGRTAVTSRLTLARETNPIAAVDA